MPTINLKTRGISIVTATEGLPISVQTVYRASINNLLTIISELNIINKVESIIRGGVNFISAVADIINNPTITITTPLILNFIVDILNDTSVIIRHGVMKLVKFNGSCEISTSTPALITRRNHGFYINDAIMFNSTQSLPWGLTEGTPYYVTADNLSVHTFQVSNTRGGASINTYLDGSGSLTCGKLLLLSFLKNLKPVMISNYFYITATPEIRNLKKLSDYDSSALSALDGQTLDQLYT